MLHWAVGFALATTCGVAPSAPFPQEPVRVAVVTGGHSFEVGFYGLFEGQEDLAVTRLHFAGTEPAPPDAVVVTYAEFVERAAEFDVLVLYDMFNGAATEAEVARLRSLLREGRGLVALHHTLAALQEWPAYRQIIGGCYHLAETEEAGRQVPASTYRHDVRFRVEVADPDHPITRGLADFDLVDEVYGGFSVAPDSHVLLTTAHSESGPKIGWTRDEGRGRVVYLEMGHGASAFENESYQKLVGRAVRWAAGRLAPGTDAAGFRPLFDGATLEGWEASGAARWAVEDGLLAGRQGPAGEAGDLFHQGEFSDFELKVAFRVQWPANSGVWFRYQSPSAAYQADILEYQNPRCWSGSLYCTGKMFIAMNEDPALVNREGWNTFHLRAVGDQLTLKLNGHPVADVRDDSHARGRVGFQVHAGAEFEGMAIEVREIAVKECRR